MLEHSKVVFVRELAMPSPVNRCEKRTVVLARDRTARRLGRILMWELRFLGFGRLASLTVRSVATLLPCREAFYFGVGYGCCDCLNARDAGTHAWAASALAVCRSVLILQTHVAGPKKSCPQWQQRTGDSAESGDGWTDPPPPCMPYPMQGLHRCPLRSAPTLTEVDQAMRAASIARYM